MAEGDAKCCDQQSNSTRKKLPKDGTERLKPYRWKKGQSGNPDGVKKKLPISDARVEMLGRPLPDSIRHDLEAAAKVTLPKSMTVADGIVFGEVLALFGKFEKGFKTEALRELRDSVEGRAAYRPFVPGEDLEGQADDVVSVEDRVMLGLLRVVKRRQELFGGQSPQLDSMLDEAKQLMAKKAG